MFFITLLLAILATMAPTGETAPTTTTTTTTTTTIAPPAPAPTVATGTAPVPPCPATTFSDWHTIPSCDLDGSQTWVLRTGELATRADALATMGECHAMGGVWAYDDYDVIVAYCIDVDY